MSQLNSMRYHENKLAAMRAGAAVSRCHTIPLTRSYTVGQHTNGMLQILFLLHEECNLENVDMLYRAILLHDLPEVITGDIPAPVKKRIDNEEPSTLPLLERNYLRSIGQFDRWDEGLNPAQVALVKAIDSLELMAFAFEEVAHFGNRSVLPMLMRAQENLIGHVTNIRTFWSDLCHSSRDPSVAIQNMSKPYITVMADSRAIMEKVSLYDYSQHY